MGKEAREQRGQEEIVGREEFATNMEETQDGGSELCCDPASCRTGSAAGCTSMLLLDSIFHPALPFFLIATPV